MRTVSHRRGRITQPISKHACLGLAFIAALGVVGSLRSQRLGVGQTAAARRPRAVQGTCFGGRSVTPGSPRDDSATHAALDGLGTTAVERGDILETCALTAYGGGANEKLLCAMPIPRYGADADCVIVSLGSKNEWQFEAAMLNETACRVETFDCTVETPRTPLLAKYPKRLRFHRLCIGAEDDPARNMGTWRTIAHISMGPSDTQIVALNMDVDRFECDIFAEFAKLRRVQDGTVVDGSYHAAYEGDAHLAPLQIAFELHAVVRPPARACEAARAPLAWPSGHLTELRTAGYRVVDRRDHPHRPRGAQLLVVDATVFAANRDANLYSLGDRFDMPKYLLDTLWPTWAPEMVDHRARIADALPSSILARYRTAEARETNGACSSFENATRFCGGVHAQAYPDIPLLRRVLAVYGRHAPPHPFARVHARNDTLLVHVRAGDRLVDSGTLEAVRAFVFSYNFRHVRLLGAAHGDTRYGPKRANADRYLSVIAGALGNLGGCRATYHVSTSPDDDLYQISLSKHFFMMSGGFSMLAALVAGGTVYHTPSAVHRLSGAYLEALHSEAGRVVCVEPRGIPSRCSAPAVALDYAPSAA